MKISKSILLITAILMAVLFTACPSPNGTHTTGNDNQQELEEKETAGEQDQSASPEEQETPPAEEETSPETSEKIPEIDDSDYIPEDSIPDEDVPDELTEWFVLEKEYYVNQTLEDLYICFYDKEFVKAVYRRGSVKQNPFKPWKYDDVSVRGKKVALNELPEFCK